MVFVYIWVYAKQITNSMKCMVIKDTPTGEGEIQVAVRVESQSPQ